MNRRKLILKRALALLMASGLCLSSADLSVFAKEKKVIRYSQLIDLSTIPCQSDIATCAAADGTVDLKNGNYEKWIDRIDVPDYGIQFYNTLVEYTDYDGEYDYLIEDDSFSKETASIIDFGEEYGSDTLHGIPIATITADKTADITYEFNYVYMVIRSVYDSFLMDHPEVFWLSGTSWAYTLSSYDYDAEMWKYDVYFPTIVFEGSQILGDTMEYFDVREEKYQTNGQIKSDLAIRDQAIKEILETEEVVNAKNDYETIKALNSWLTKNNEYNTEVAVGNGVGPHYVHNCLSALKGDYGTTGPVCEAYAKAFKVLCDKKGIPCVMVLGDAYVSPTTSTPEPHAWNNVKVGGKWYAADVTWNDPAVTGAGVLSGYENESYLLVGGETSIGDMTFSASHVVNNAASVGGLWFINGPELSKDHYVQETHDYGTEWKKDDSKHWKECECGARSEEAEHTFEWVTDEEASEFEIGKKHEECKTCHAKRNENTEIPATHEHSYGTDWVYDADQHWKECACKDKTNVADHTFEWVTDKEASEFETGKKHEECKTCHAKRNENTEIPATHEHSYGTDWIYDADQHWKECACKDKTNVADHTFEWVTDKEASEFETGKKHEECKACHAKRNENTEIPATHEHSYGTDWGYDADQHWKECACKDKANAAEHTFEWVTDKEAVGIESGLKHEECKVCKAVRNENTVIPAEKTLDRVFGATRYETSTAIADLMKERMGVEKFDTVIVASGRENRAVDALSGSYLAVVKNAPILLTNEKEDQIAELHAYIRENVADGGMIYILGGKSALPESVDSISAEGYMVNRLKGNDRYETCTAILAEAGITGNEIIVATGKTFADSLSASATGRPILLVKPDTALNEGQKAILEKVKGGIIYIAGGTNAVTEATKAELEAYGTVSRMKGNDRYETSVEIAKTFFKNADMAVVSVGNKAADGLCGGPLAAAMGVPMILTKDENTAAAAAYMESKGITSGYVLGGEEALTDATVETVFGLTKTE